MNGCRGFLLGARDDKSLSPLGEMFRGALVRFTDSLGDTAVVIADPKTADLFLL